MKIETKIQHLEQKIRELENEKFALIHSQQPNTSKFRLDLKHELNSSDYEVAILAKQLDEISRPILRKIHNLELLERMFDANNERATAVSLALSNRKNLSRKFVPVAILERDSLATTDEEHTKIYDDLLKTL